MSSNEDDVTVEMGFEQREPRHKAREAALQMLYQWEVGGADPQEVIRTYWSIERPGELPLSPALEAFANGLVLGTAGSVAEIDPLISENAQNWRLSRMAIIDRLVLRLAVYEFLHDPDTPRTVAINEALELARTFSGDDAVKFVNGVLDAIKRKLETE